MGVRSSACALVAALTSAVAAEAHAADAPPLEPGPWSASVYGGVYLPDWEAVDNSATYGVRIARPFADHFVASGAVSYVSLDGHSERNGSVKDANFDLTLVDAEIGYVLDPTSTVSLTTAVGVGWAFTDGALKVSDGEGGFRHSSADDSFTASISVGPIVRITDRIALRIVSRWRWFEARKDDEIDQEVLAGLVFGLGGSR